MKTVLVTGASGEIGAAIAKEFAAAGYALALHGAKHIENVNQLAETFKSNGIEAYPVCGDLSDPAACERVWADTEKKLGHIDVLVNAAGITYGTTATLTPDTTVEIPLSSLSISPTLLCPAPYPVFLQRQLMPEGYDKPLDVSDIERLQLSFPGSEAEIEIIGAWLE